MSFELHFPVDEVASRLRLCDATVRRKLERGEFGDQIVDLGGGDIRVPLSGIEFFLSQGRRVYRERKPKAGIAARTAGELRRKVRASGPEATERASDAADATAWSGTKLKTA